MKTIAIAVVLVVAVPVVAKAECHCACVNGEVQNICDRSIDMEKICAPRICPLTPPSVRPLDPVTVPPIGTTECHKQQVWNGIEYEWRTICE